MNGTILLFSWGAFISRCSGKYRKVPENPESEAEAALIYASNKVEEVRTNKNEISTFLNEGGKPEWRDKDEGVDHTRDQLK